MTQTTHGAWNPPAYVVNRLKTMGLEDWTYGNDGCSSMGIMLEQNERTERYIQVFIDAENPNDRECNPNDRECPEYSRFNVSDETQSSILETDDFEQVVSMVATLLVNGA